MSITVLKNRIKYLRYALPLINLPEEMKLFNSFENKNIDQFCDNLRGIHINQKI